MSDAIKKLHDYLAMSPSVVYPEDALAYLPAIEDENAKLRELVRDMWEGYNDPRCEDCPMKDKPACADCHICAREAAVIDHMRELGVEVNG